MLSIGACGLRLRLFYAFMENSGLPAIDGTPAFNYGKRSQENQEPGRGRSTELKFEFVVLMCGACGIIFIKDRHVSHHSLL
jgi:hypothetical protein